MKPVTRQKVNIVIDIIMFVVMVALVVVGFLIRYVLLSGTRRWEKFGSNVDMTFLGLDRHQWGYIHLLIGIALVVLLVLHIVFHWKQMVCMVKRLIPSQTVLAVVGAALILACVVMIFAPVIFQPEIGEPIRGQGQGQGPGPGQGSGQRPGQGERRNRMNSLTPEEISLNAFEDVEISQIRASEKQEIKPDPDRLKRHGHEKEHSLDIKGYHTIAILASAHNVKPGELKQKLNIPVTVSNYERLGRIRRTYGFTMSEVEDCILALQENQH